MKLKIKNKYMNFSRPKIMGILNVTPDSFSDGGQYQTIENSIDHVNKMIKEGADIIDIGGESNRPGYKEISELEELDRVLPIVKCILERFDIAISVNTSKYLVMKECIKAGVHMINDIKSFDCHNTIKIIKNNSLPICIMYMERMKKNILNSKPNEIVKNMLKYFENKILKYESLGIKRNRIIIDPGFGFEKTLEQNYFILTKLEELKKINLPILVGISRKSMIGEITNQPIPKKRIIGSIVCSIIAINNGANIIRVHDVKETAEALNILSYTENIKAKL